LDKTQENPLKLNKSALSCVLKEKTIIFYVENSVPKTEKRFF